MKKKLFYLSIHLLAVVAVALLLTELRRNFALDTVKGQSSLFTLGFLHDLRSLLLIAIFIILIPPEGTKLIHLFALLIMLCFLCYTMYGWGFYSSIGLFPDTSSLSFASAYAGTDWLFQFILSYERDAILTGASVFSILTVYCIISRTTLSKCRTYIWALLIFFLGSHIGTTLYFKNLKSPHKFTQSSRELFYNSGMGPLTSLYNSFSEAEGFIENEEEFVEKLKTRLKPRLKSSKAGQLARPFSSILISIESLIPEAQNLTCNESSVMPFLKALTNQSILFSHAYAPSSHSDYSDPAVYSSRFPIFSSSHVYFSPADAWPRPILHTSFKQLNFKTAHFSSQNESWGGMRYFFPKDIMDIFFDPETSNLPTYLDKKDSGAYRGLASGAMTKGNLHDSATVDAAVKWLQENSKEHFIMSLNFQTSHFPYTLPENELAGDLRHPCGEAVLGKGISFGRYRDEKVDLVQRAYKNALFSIDRQLKILFDSLKKLNIADKTLIVIYGDNGESFGTHGIYSHGNLPFENQLRVFFSMTLPGMLGPRIETQPVSLLDIAPSLYQLATNDKFYDFQGSNILREAGTVKTNRTIWMHVDSPLAFSDGVLIDNRWKYFIDLKRSGKYLFDLKNDPKEINNLVEECPSLAEAIEGKIKDQRRDQILYYKHAELYGNYYPPELPDLDTGLAQSDCGSL